MGKKTEREIVDVFNQKGIFLRSDYTFVEYVDELFKFQTEAAKLIFNMDEVNGIRMNEVVARCEAIAREKNLGRNQEVYEGIAALKTINKEISIAMAGKKGEDRVANTFQYVNRPDASFYRNVYVNDELEETEMDAVVITKNGAIIIEIKNAKEDITIDPSGRLLYNNATCYHDMSIGEKMDRKRRLLKTRIANEFMENGINKDVVVNSILVFSTPSGVRINVHDQFKQENYCFRGKLFSRIDGFESEVTYSDNELKLMNQILSNMETEQKRFELKFDPEMIKCSFAKAYIALTSETEEAEKKVLAFEEVKEKINTVHQRELKGKKYSYILPVTAAIAMCVGAVAIPAVSLVGAGVTGGILSATLKK